MNRETLEEPKQEYEYIGECKGNNGNGCFMDSCGHNCGCYVRIPKQETLEEAVEQLLINDYKKVVGEELNKYELNLIKWLASSAKKYSEEEVLEILLKHQSDYRR